MRGYVWVGEEVLIFSIIFVFKVEGIVGVFRQRGVEKDSIFFSGNVGWCVGVGLSFKLFFFFWYVWVVGVCLELDIGFYVLFIIFELLELFMVWIVLFCRELQLELELVCGGRRCFCSLVFVVEQFGKGIIIRIYELDF